MLDHSLSEAAFTEAKSLMPGGVNSPVRSGSRVHCTPPFIHHAQGCTITDIDGHTYIDYIGSWGPMIAGHAHPRIVRALAEAAARGTSYGAPTLLESEIVKKVQSLYPSIEMMRMVNSGTEATMSALRVARGTTGRNKIVKFQGCYHGHADSLLVAAGSGAATFGRPDSPGVTPGTAADTLTVPYNDIPAFIRLMDSCGEEVAAVIVEPVAGNMGTVLPIPGFLEALRAETEKHGAVLFPDEPSRRTGLLWHYTGYDLPGQDYRRRSPGCCLWRQKEPHEPGIPCRPHLPGWYSQRQSPGCHGRAGNIEDHYGRPRLYRKGRRKYHISDKRPAQGCQKSWCTGLHPPERLHVQRVLYG